MGGTQRRGPEPPRGLPDIQFNPGMADELMSELAPPLAEEGIDTLLEAVDRAVGRRNIALFTPVGDARQIAGGKGGAFRSLRTPITGQGTRAARRLRTCARASARRIEIPRPKLIRTLIH
ncbi:MAG: hypothetical protein QOC66_1145 [Pseudonocardiales bacterium]|jgi:hypothetical protein|nr:hypothetical protein [Pseudonocardiales bacterium]